MRLTIHNVGHGACISLLHYDSGNVMLWDCGHSNDNRPSVFLPQMGVRNVSRFIVTNYDEDHISDLVNLRREVNLCILRSNQSIDARRLRQLKEQGGPISEAMKAMLDMMSQYTGNVHTPPAFPGVVHTDYCNPFFRNFNDTNNCSLVTFLSCNGTKFVFPGDLERAGWKKLLETSSFREELAGVHYFVASHHGRESGYCKEVFDYCKPRAVIFSDSNIKYATQEMAAIYGQHCPYGVTFRHQHRNVLSTRKDGDICWPLDFSA